MDASPAPPARPGGHPAAIAQAVFVTFLWSTSWVLIKLGLRDDLPALTFAGLRYTLAFVCLAPFVLADRRLQAGLCGLAPRRWAELALLGTVYYTFTQGAQFLSLVFLPAAMVGLLLSLTPILVGGLGILLLGERPTGRQWSGLVLCVAGVALYFAPAAMPAARAVGIVVAFVCLLANAGGAVLGRTVNRRAHLPALAVTFVSMGIGGDPVAGAWTGDPGIGNTHGSIMALHRLAGRGQHGAGLHALESHPAHALGH